MTPDEARRVAEAMLGRGNRRTWAPRRIRALFSFPSNGDAIRATLHVHYADFKRLRDEGLIEGEAGDAVITPAGLAVQAALREIGE